MKSEDEVRTAMHHAMQQLGMAIADGDIETGLPSSIAVDILRWVLGYESDFDKLMRNLHVIDRARRQ